MYIFENKQWQLDINEVIKKFKEFSALCGKTILITGATGLICSALIDILIYYNETYGGNITIVAAGRSCKKVKRRFGNYIYKKYFKFVEYDALGDNTKLDLACDYIIHGANNAYPGKVMKEPVETMVGNFCGLKSLLEYAKRYGVSRVLYISSSEVYGQKNSDKQYFENDYGYVDLLNPRNSYSVGKRAAETLCVSFSNEYKVDTVIVRPGHIYGPTASVEDNRVSSEWAFTVARGENIVMKSDGSQLRSYCYCLDCASAILLVLLKGQIGNAYNISNQESIITIKAMAELLAKIAGVKLILEVPSKEETKAFNPMDNSSLDSTKLQQLGWRGIFSAQKGLSHTVAILKDIIN